MQLAPPLNQNAVLHFTVFKLILILDLFVYRGMLFHQTQKYFVLFWAVVFHQGSTCLWLAYLRQHRAASLKSLTCYSHLYSSKVYPILCFHVKYKLGSSSFFAGEQAGGRPSNIHACIRVLPCRISVIVVKYVVCICAPLIKQGCIERNIKPEKDNSFTAPSGPSEFTKSTSLINIQAFYFCFAQVIS